MRYVIEVNYERCLGCHTCELECALAHSDSDDFARAIRSGEKLYPRIILERDGDTTLPMHCRHCADAPCIEVCPTGAMSRKNPDDPVVLDRDRCIGCTSCILVCPFGIIRIPGADNLPSKCDLCVSRLEEGKTPACAAACPTRAIRFVPVEDLTESRRKEVIEKFRVSLARGDDLRG